jgi:hypothetical protein
MGSLGTNLRGISAQGTPDMTLDLTVRVRSYGKIAEGASHYTKRMNSPFVAVKVKIGVVLSAHKKYGRAKFALPEFAGITKCAYFDYQRDKNHRHLQPRIKKQSLRCLRCKRSPSRVTPAAP